MNRIAIAAACAAVLTLGACGEKAQTLDGSARKADAKAWAGVAAAPAGYAAPGWTPGDKTSWEQQLKLRAQGQNEYARAAAKP